MATAEQTKLFLSYQPLVRKIALAIASKVPPQISRDDLISAGNLGLLQAIRHCGTDPVPDGFTAYVSMRVRGAVLDELRSGDPLSRRDRRAVSRLKRLENSLGARFGGDLDSTEIAEQCGLDAAEYRRLKCAERASQTVEVDENLSFSRSTDISALCDARFVRNLVAELPLRLQVVIRGYYHEELSLRQVGERLGVTESRAHQLLSKALEELKAMVEKPAPAGSSSLRRRVAPPSMIPAAAA